LEQLIVLTGIPTLVVVYISESIHVLEAHAVGSPSIWVESSLPVVSVMSTISEASLLASESPIETLIVLWLPKIAISTSPHMYIQSIIRPAIKYFLIALISHKKYHTPKTLIIVFQ
jgi:hypothetical protein